ncbi:DUF2247 family protein [Paenibacillus sp. FSL L8-0463]|uniref:DUF2247 family protein n=1 Tax=Paenibacillus sp. FSL L8-0463 TaxID=2954687 RepID=UPI00311990F8
MNTLNLLIPYNYIVNLINLTWSDLFFAIKHGYLNPEAATEHAMYVISEEEFPSQDVIDLAWLKKGEDVHPYLDKLLAPMSMEEYSIAQEKILYVVLKWVFENKEHYADPFEVVETIYADFDYPEEISQFVRYMPSNQPLLDLVDFNKERLYKNWSDYLEKQKKKYSVSDER